MDPGATAVLVGVCRCLPRRGAVGAMAEATATILPAMPAAAWTHSLNRTMSAEWTSSARTTMSREADLMAETRARSMSVGEVSILAVAVTLVEEEISAAVATGNDRLLRVWWKPLVPPDIGVFHLWGELFQT